ncbi:MAG: hypothetical protein H8F28_06160 [Fibrella sp.]|nr:hypothetical protein [Armatimonadota bacterium]
MIYRDGNGRELTEADLANATGTVNWSIAGKDDVPQKAQVLHQQARVAGGAGDYKMALNLLSQANKEAPDWPYPLYDAGFTFLLTGETNKALENYAAALRLAPRGFFTAITAVDTLKREKQGDLPPGTYKQFVQWEWMENPVEKKRAVESMIRQTPNFAPAYKELASLLDDDVASLQAIEKGLTHKPDAETRGFLLVNKSLILSRQDKKEQAVQILGDLILNPATPTDIEQIARSTLADISR